MILTCTECLITVVILSLICWLFVSNRKPKRYPPGPYGIPFLGYMPFLDSVSPHKSITRLSKKYGDVFSLTLGNRDVVYLNSYEAAKEGLNNPHVQGRPGFATFKLFSSAFLHFDSEPGLLHRNFALHHLKQFGFGKASLEPVIAGEAEKLVRRFAEENGRPFQVSNNLNITIVNIIWHMTASMNLDETDPFFHMLMDHTKKTEEALSASFLADFLTWGCYVFPKWLTKLDDIQALEDVMVKFNQKLIEEHEATLDVDNPRDYIDAFLIKMKEDQKNSVEDTTFTYHILNTNMTALFVAGGETSSTSIRNALLLLTQHPEVQEKLHEEIQSVTEGKRRVTLQDKYKLPYLEAFIMECHRYGSIVPLSVPHRATENTTIGGYHIPKDTIVFLNTWGIHFDERYWPDPLRFDPGRFLHKDGTVNYTKEGYLPFAIGKRLCLGHELAKAELLLFLGYLLQEFTFSTPPGAPPVSILDAKGGIVLYVDPFDVIATRN